MSHNPLSMRILLIGNFAPPYEEESIHNFSLLHKLSGEGHECSVINISSQPSKEKDCIDSGGYLSFLFKVIRMSWRRDVMHFLTKGYTRLGLLKLMSSILICRIFRVRPIITLHSELFSIIGQMRSPVGGEQTVYLSFSFAHKIIFGDKDTYEAAAKYKKRSNFELVPLFIDKNDVAKGIGESEYARLKEKKKIILFAGVSHPSFIFNIVSHFLSDYMKTPDVGVVIAFAETSHVQLQGVLEEAAGDMAEHLIFSGPDDLAFLSQIYSMAHIIVRPLSCDGKPFFHDFAVYIRRPSVSEHSVYFPRSMVLSKEGDMADICAFITQAFLSQKSGGNSEEESEDYYASVKRLYTE